MSSNAVVVKSVPAFDPWAQGYASYTNMYGALIVMTVIFSGLISLLFAVRDRVLVWQKGIVKW